MGKDDFKLVSGESLFYEKNNVIITNKRIIWYNGTGDLTIFLKHISHVGTINENKPILGMVLLVISLVSLYMGYEHGEMLIAACAFIIFVGFAVMCYVGKTYYVIGTSNGYSKKFESSWGSIEVKEMLSTLRAQIACI